MGSAAGNAGRLGFTEMLAEGAGGEGGGRFLILDFVSALCCVRYEVVCLNYVRFM